MLNVEILFDKTSLAISKDDFDIISNGYFENSTRKFIYTSETNGFVCYENDKILFVVYFDEIAIFDSTCYEITEIKYSIQFTKRFVTDNVFTQTTMYNIIIDVFDSINSILFNSGNEIKTFYKYYVRNKIKKKDSLFNSIERIDLSSIIYPYDGTYKIYDI